MDQRNILFRYTCTVRTFFRQPRFWSGWIPETTISETWRTRKRCSGSLGINGHSGYTSSKYSMMASDWVRHWLSMSNAGTWCIGFNWINSSLFCSSLSKLTKIGSYRIFFSSRAIRTRHAHELRKYVNNLIGPADVAVVDAILFLLTRRAVQHP